MMSQSHVNCKVCDLNTIVVSECPMFLRFHLEPLGPAEVTAAETGTRDPVRSAKTGNNFIFQYST